MHQICPTCHKSTLELLDAGLYRTGWIAQDTLCHDPWHDEKVRQTDPQEFLSQHEWMK